MANVEYSCKVLRRHSLSRLWTTLLEQRRDEYNVHNSNNVNHFKPWTMSTCMYVKFHRNSSRTQTYTDKPNVGRPNSMGYSHNSPLVRPATGRLIHVVMWSVTFSNFVDLGRSAGGRACSRFWGLHLSGCEVESWPDLHASFCHIIIYYKIVLKVQKK